MSRVCLLLLAALLACAHAYEDPERKPTGIADDEDAAVAVTGELGNPLHLHCLASQYPTLFVFWYRGHGRAKLLYNDFEYGIRGNVLLIRNLTIESLGQYTCQTYNAEGMVAPRFLVVRAYMPDEVFIANEWLVPRNTAITPEALGQLFTDESGVGAFEGGTATLRCPLGVPWLHSDPPPPPKITWKFGQLTIDGNTSRYRLMSDGALEIVSLYRNDTGVYICLADIGHGVATQEIHLAVNDPVRIPAGISGDENATVTGELGSSLHLRCLAYGYPPPFVFWYRGYEEASVLYNDVEYEIIGNDLIFRSLRIDTLGQYTCRAYNGVGKVASWVVAVRAYKPDGIFIEHEWLVPRSTVAPRPRTQQSSNATTTTTTTTTTTAQAPRPLITETIITGEITETSEETIGSFEAHEHSTTNEDTFVVISTTTLDPCKAFEFGCCADKETKASGPDGQGCPCYATEFGCCPDLLSPAAGRENKGCCRLSMYGCCQDDTTPAHGPDFEGCCLLQPFGCCPDNRKPAHGPHLEGCGCQYTLHGCCPDNVTVAQGPDNQGCGCQYTQHGCCPDRHTTASGPNYEGCACKTYQFGCCADGITIAKGPEQGGCHCYESKFGCCGDGETHATGPDAAGCDCSSSRHGCCPDGHTEATGPKFLGCIDAPENKQAACRISTDPGPCHNFTVMWYYDLAYGSCSRFWYGGCDGNGNRFATKEECEDVCVKPSPKDACKLPSVKGACDADYQRWHYNSTREQCIPFIYGGCLGNANNFRSRELCQKQCEHSSVTGQCKLPIDKGSCAGKYSRWGFNSDVHCCEQFIWGGCEGNANRFSTEADCQMRCAGTHEPQCTQPQEPGNCTEKEALWSFSQSENRCLPFYYSGCGGNENRFRFRETCERTCPSTYVPDKCTLPAETGECSNYRKRWFYDTTFKGCRQFYYGGCGGNDNNFATEAECDNSCLEIMITTARHVEPQPRPAEPESGQAAPERSDVPAVPLALPQQEPEVLASEGGTATLRCLFHGNPPPKMTWRFGELTIDGNAGRYRLMSDGALEIVPLYRNDTGIYICVADNGLGVATQAIHLAVNDPMKIPVGIAGDAETVVIGELGRPLHVRCLAYGYPPPFVFWYHGSEGFMVPYSDAVYEARGNVLLIRTLALKTLGQYTCKAYNGEGKAASWVVFVRAYMPEGLFIENELLVPRDPVMVPRPRTQPPTTAETISTTTSTTTEAPRPLFTVPVSTHVSLKIATLNIGADLFLTCALDGFPEPDVHWTKDGGTIHLDDRITITGSTYVSRLTVTRVTVTDSGLYACHASNPYSSQSDTAQIKVQQIVVPAKCTDNVQFANCDLVVQGKICKHKYYSKFCCKSCVEAGQLNPQEMEA